ncbi:MAG TPA: glycosyltransferase [Patescibacteria group bacterium]|nr:glycosyltransferase [Patescibacteria group bacterium]
MKVALVHDYIKEYGGAERVLEVLCELFPQAPIYTAFCARNSQAYKHFKDKQIITSWVQFIPFFKSKLYSPLRFLTPLIWGSFNLSQYDLVVSSSSWYIAKGFKKKNDRFKEICYCHTPPRWLYGYSTSVNFQKYWLVKVYALIIGHFLRLYDFKQAQKVDYFIANSKEVQSRIKKFYRRNATVIYPPVSLPLSNPKSEIRNPKSENDYYFIVSRIVGAKGLDLAVDAALKMGFKLKIAGSPAGYYFEHDKLVKKSQNKVEFLGQVSDEELVKLYKGAKGFLALSQDEDFGITPVESMLCGTPVIAFNGGGYKETVIDGKTGVLFNDYSVDGLIKAVKKFESLKFSSADCITQAEKFSKERFKKEIKEFIEKHAGVTRS